MPQVMPGVMPGVKPGVMPGVMPRGMNNVKLCIWPDYELRSGPWRVHLTPHEGLMMTTLLDRREVTLDLLVEVLWPHPDDMPDLWYRSLMVRLHRLRRKLESLGWTVAVRQGFGWRLEERPRTSSQAGERLAA